MPVKPIPSPTPTQNACRLCAPLGASLAFRGVQSCVAVLHGSQGCATYIRRYLIGHFREPMDIASSSFHEEAAIFGGEKNLIDALENVITQYQPAVIGVASTCLAETIGEDLPMILKAFAKKNRDVPLPRLVQVSTPSYKGSHTQGFHATTRAIAEALAIGGEPIQQVAIFPGMISPADMRYLEEVLHDFALPAVIAPDYSDTLDGQAVAQYQPLPAGGTPISQWQSLGRSLASISLTATTAEAHRAGAFLQQTFSVPEHVIGQPIGIKRTDTLFLILERLSGNSTPEKHRAERGRLIDAYVDGHKFLFGKKVAIYGDEDLVASLAGFVSELGMRPSVCATGGKSPLFKKVLHNNIETPIDDVEVLEDADFADVEAAIERTRPDIVLGHSKGYPMSRRIHAPLIRVGFPIHDRIGAQRVHHIGYRGTQELFDRIINALLETQQNASSVGYINW